MALSESHIRIKQGPDELIWCPADHGSYVPKQGYCALIAHRSPDQVHPWWHSIWKLRATPRSKLFFWCALHGIVPTGEQLTRRAIQGPSWCIFCKNASEYTDHIFLFCPTIQTIWRNICQQLGITGDWSGADLQEAWCSWARSHPESKILNLPPVAIWYVWLARNRAIFEDKPFLGSHIEIAVIAAYQELPEPTPTRTRVIQPMPEIDGTIPWAFFDGASNQTRCGSGFVLHINENHRYLAKLGFGIGTNNFAELSALYNLLHFALSHHITQLNIFGDSMVVVNWINNVTNCHVHMLSNLFQNTLTLKAAFEHFTCVHIYREHNSEADKLSKEASSLPRGNGQIVEQNGSEEHQFYHRPYIDQRMQRDNSPNS